MKKKNEEQEIYERLSYPFDREAIQLIPYGKLKLHTIKAQYIVERLNEVLGFSGWSMHGEYMPTDKGVLYKGVLKIKAFDHEVEAVGYSDFNQNNLGYSYKSAKTDALSKAASWIGVGNDVFKGKGDEAPPPDRNHLSTEDARRLREKCSSPFLDQDEVSKWLFDGFGIGGDRHFEGLTYEAAAEINEGLEDFKQKESDPFDCLMEM